MPLRVVVRESCYATNMTTLCSPGRESGQPTQSWLARQICPPWTMSTSSESGHRASWSVLMFLSRWGRVSNTLTQTPLQMNVLQQAQLYVEQLRREAGKTRINVSEAVTGLKVWTEIARSRIVDWLVRNTSTRNRPRTVWSPASAPTDPTPSGRRPPAVWFESIEI